MLTILLPLKQLDVVLHTQTHPRKIENLPRWTMGKRMDKNGIKLKQRRKGEEWGVIVTSYLFLVIYSSVLHCTIQTCAIDIEIFYLSQQSLNWGYSPKTCVLNCYGESLDLLLYSNSRKYSIVRHTKTLSWVCGGFWQWFHRDQVSINHMMIMWPTGCVG